MESWLQDLASELARQAAAAGMWWLAIAVVVVAAIIIVAVRRGWLTPGVPDSPSKMPDVTDVPDSKVDWETDPDHPGGGMDGG